MGMPPTGAVLAALALALLAARLDACVFLYGDAPGQPPSSATRWSHNFAGDDWVEGQDTAGHPWVCATGHTQSPINISPGARYKKLANTRLRTHWEYGTWESNGTNIQVINNGHTIQVQWPGVTWPSVKTSIGSPDYSNVTGASVVSTLRVGKKSTPVKRIPTTPLQFHFHTRSEHTVDGEYFPLELHIVHTVKQADLPACPPTGCLTVTGILIRVEDGPDNPLIAPILDAAPFTYPTVNYLPAGAMIELDKLITDPTRYISYEGSLTTPPCTEGLLWHVLVKPISISVHQLRKYNVLVGAKNCTEPAHHHHHHHHRRHMHTDEPRKPLDEFPLGPDGTPYNCTITAYGQNYRMIQTVGSRLIKRSW